MNKLRLRKKGHPDLYEVASPVPLGEDLSDQVNFMWETLYKNRGIGLAGNQVGLLKRVFVMDVNGFKKVIINPELFKVYGGKHTAREGCLSFPGAQILKVRYKQVIVTGYDLEWSQVKYKLKGLAARCAQHEIDHLNGINIE